MPGDGNETQLLDTEELSMWIGLSLAFGFVTMLIVDQFMKIFKSKSGDDSYINDEHQMNV